MRVLICTQEYDVDGSGIAKVVNYLENELKNSGIQIEICSPEGPHHKIGSKKMIQKFGGIGLCYYWIQVACFIKHANYDVIWVHNPLFITKIPNKNVLSTVHTTYVNWYALNRAKEGFTLKTMYYYIMKLFEGCCYKKNKFTVMAISPNVAKDVRTLGVRNIKIIPNGVDTVLFRPIKKKRSNTITFISVGRLNWMKQPDKLVETFRELQDSNYTIKLVVAGGGEEFSKIQQLIKDKKIYNVSLLGPISHNDLPKWYRHSDFFIMASSTEGFPLALLEAMSCGLPCVLSDIDIFNYIHKKVKTGIVISFDDPSQAARKIIKYLMNVNYSTESLKTHTYVRKNLSWTRVASCYCNEFKKFKK
ncbi:MAG: hypothetical protein C0412_19740 [Flavobacterium sp.]|nr:hypothetical protein [Flavobacterium sp.]